MPALWTIGHSTRSLGAFVELLRAHGIEQLVDVRSLPRSRRYPHFGSERLAEELRARGIAYAHAPELGGLRSPRSDSTTNSGLRNAGFRAYADHMQTPAFQSALAALLTRAQRARTAVMCAEAVPWRCHRSLLSDALLARGVAVLHILSEAPARPHALHEQARVAQGRVDYPGPAGLFDSAPPARPADGRR